MSGYGKLTDSLGEPDRKTLSDIVGSQTAISFEAQDNGVMVNVTGFAGAKALIKNASNECGHYAEVLYYEQLIEMLASLHEDMTDRLARSRRRFLASECSQRDAMRKGRRSRQDSGDDMPPELQSLIDLLRDIGANLQVVEVSKDQVKHILDRSFAKLLKEMNERPDIDDEDATDEVEYEEDNRPAEKPKGEDESEEPRTLNDFNESAGTGGYLSGASGAAPLGHSAIDIPEQRKSED